MPELLIALATLALVWFGVKRGLAPLEDLSNEIRARSARDLRPIDQRHAPEEARPRRAVPSWVITVGSLVVLLGAWEIFGRDINPVFGSYPSAIAEARPS